MSALKKITTRAKQLQKKHPGKQWKNAIKEASREYNAGKLGKVAIKSIDGFRRKRKAVREMKTKIVNKIAHAGLTVAAAKHFIKKDLEEKLKNALYKAMASKTKTERKKARRHISELKAQLKKLQ